MLPGTAAICVDDALFATFWTKGARKVAVSVAGSWPVCLKSCATKQRCFLQLIANPLNLTARILRVGFDDEIKIARGSAGTTNRTWTRVAGAQAKGDL